MTDAFRATLQEALAPAYTLERELTGGGMSRVFVATEHALGRTVVVKVLSPELSAGVNRDRFRREMQLAAQLQHPHIVPLLSAGEHGQLLYYTMPYIDGESLRARLASQGRLPVRDVVRMLHDVVDALAYAHRRGVIHRDIKPANILMHGMHALVTDFGVAKALSAALPHSGTTSVGVAMGTPAYMAPEQLAADPAADRRVDIYAVGLVAYELLTGSSPFTAPSPRETMAAQLTRMPQPLHECCPDVPPALSAVIMRCLEKSPEARFDTADALLAALDDATLSTLATSVGGGTAAGASGFAALAAGAAAGPPTPPGSSSPGTPPGTPPATPADAGRGHTPARRWLMGGALVIAGLLAGVAMAVRWQAQRAAEAARSVTVLTGTPDAPRSVVVPGISGSIAPDSTPAATELPPTSAPPRELTRADSLAIAAAVRERMEAKPPERVAGMATIDSVQVMIQHMVADSVAHALRQAERVVTRLGVPRGGWGTISPEELQRLSEMSGRAAERGVRGEVPRAGAEPYPAVATRRLVLLAEVQNRTGRREMNGLSVALGRALRERLAEGDGYDVRRAPGLPAGAGRDGGTFAAQMGAGALLTPTLTMRGDSVVLQVVVVEPRRGRVRGSAEASAPASNPMETVDGMAEALRPILARLDWPAVRVVPVVPAPPVPPAPPAPAPPPSD